MQGNVITSISGAFVWNPFHNGVHNIMRGEMCLVVLDETNTCMLAFGERIKVTSEGWSEDSVIVSVRLLVGAGWEEPFSIIWVVLSPSEYVIGLSCSPSACWSRRRRRGPVRAPMTDLIGSVDILRCWDLDPSLLPYPYSGEISTSEG